MSCALDYVRSDCGMAGEEVAKQVDGLEGQVAALEQQLLATQAHVARLVDLWAEVEQEYLALLKEKDEEAEAFKAEGNMYGWNFHKGVRSGAVEMHLNMTKLIKALSSPINLDALHEDRALECERLAGLFLKDWLIERAAAHRERRR